MVQANRSITWDGLRFALPAGMIDQSVLTFVDKTDLPSLSVTLSQEKLEGGRPGLLRYVTDQIRDIQRSVPGWAVVGQNERAVGDLAAIHVQATIAGAGRKRVQHQLYALDERNARVVVATITAHDSSTARAAALLEDIAGSLALTGSP